MASPLERNTYWIKDHRKDYLFSCGRSLAGSQVLMSFIGDNMFTCVFTGSGDYLRTELRSPKDSWNDVSGLVNDSIYDVIWKRIGPWEKSIGLARGPIQVKGFFDENNHIGIADYPAHITEYINDPNAFDEIERENIIREMREWETEGRFVLWVGNQDYHMEIDGSVSST